MHCNACPREAPMVGELVVAGGSLTLQDAMEAASAHVRRAHPGRSVPGSLAVRTAPLGIVLGAVPSPERIPAAVDAFNRTRPSDF
ncbi:hypothetical protein GCM10010302_26420 [Streptomyces polychromogenes]|uniref:Uncharacterized protein n=2 Tax=Streptomyces TaxID=1883 RepID=A0ABN0VCJ6_9ACTN